MCLYPSTVIPDTEKEQEWTPVTGPLLAFKEEDQLLVRRLSRHVLSGEGELGLGLQGRLLSHPFSLGWLVARTLHSNCVSAPDPPPSPVWLAWDV